MEKLTAKELISKLDKDNIPHAIVDSCIEFLINDVSCYADIALDGTIEKIYIIDDQEIKFESLLSLKIYLKQNYAS